MSRWKQMTFHQLCQLEPQLRALEMEAKSIPSERGFCANKVWRESGGLKSRLRALVGSEGCYSSNKTLRSSEAYDVVYQHLWSLLPDCRHLGCCRY